MLRSESLETVQHAASLDTSLAAGPACSANQIAYAVLSNSDMAVIDMGPSTDSGKTEARMLDSKQQYKNYKETTPIETRLHLSAGRNNNGEWTFLADGSDNLLAINSGVTASNMTEVHRLKMPADRANPYQEFDVQVITALPHRTGFDEWDFLLDSSSNLMLIKKGPTTASAMTEVHMMKAAQSWQVFTTALPLPTGLHLSASTNNNGDWAFLLDGADNLICIRRPEENDASIGVKRLTAGSNYQSFDIENGGALLPNGGNSHADVHWLFQIDPADDILCIKEGPITAQGFTEIHTLAMSANYTTFNSHQEKTGAPCREPYFIDSAGTR